MEEEPLRIKGCLTQKTEREFIEVTLETEDDLSRITKRLDSPIFQCSETTFTIDAQKKIKYTLKK